MKKKYWRKPEAVFAQKIVEDGPLPEGVIKKTVELDGKISVQYCIHHRPGLRIFLQPGDYLIYSKYGALDGLDKEDFESIYETEDP